MRQSKSWQFWIDRGGTFTDVVVLRPDGRFETQKLLSENPEQYEDAAAEAIARTRHQWQNDGGGEFPIAAIKMGTTVATNALLERRGSPTVFIVTKGFADSVAIGYQNRPDIFALNIQKPAPLYSRVIEASERVNHDGDVLLALDESSLRQALEQCVSDGITSAAICFVHGYRHRQHETRAAELARQAGFSQVSVSHEVEPLIKFVSRAETTLADAYLSPILRKYVQQLRGEMRRIAEPARLLFMQSNGGLIDADQFRGKNSILSGPAAGVVGMVESARGAGFERLVGFDMGGTSTDVSAWSGRYERSNDSEIGGVKLRAPMMRIHTIAAGGSSILSYEDSRYQVGPQSAGAIPGPACYRRGGPPTITDANVCLGRIPVSHFPSIFGPGGDEPLDRAASDNAFRETAAAVSANSGRLVDACEVAAGFLTVAIENMANAIRKITIERGDDVREFTLCSFGGAGGQHACRVADVLGIQTVWLHPMAGVLSAWGMGLADIRTERQQSLDIELRDENAETWQRIAVELQAQCEQSLDQQEVPSKLRRFRSTLGVRVRGSDNIIDVRMDNVGNMRTDFAAQYARRFGASHDSEMLMVAIVKVAGTGKESEFDEPFTNESSQPAISTSTPMWFGGRWRDVPVYDRGELGAGSSIVGPAIVAEKNGTTVIETGWIASVNERGHLTLRSTSARTIDVSVADGRPDPVRLEVFNQLFMHIAEQMGVVLQNTALSVNIRERLDFSCAMFDAGGRLISNAPHMPVHLGSMGESVRSVISALGQQIRDGDSIMLNSPYNGGTHLPDITVVTPWFAESDRPLFYFASRAHHADIGGISPGSMPSSSTCIGEEGVLIDNVFLVRDGEFLTAKVQALLSSGENPARNPKQNIADLKAQLAANQQGIRQLKKTIQRYGYETVAAYVRFVRENAADSVRRLLTTLHDGEFRYELDSGEAICVRITVDKAGNSASVDFTGTSPQSTSNFNAPQAVTRAAVLYVFRSLIRDAIPMNEGCLQPLRISIPEGSMLSPSYPAAVVAGNVETSQCVTDTLFGALGVLAASQGTMNNLSFGNERTQYYETIAGGAGAGRGFNGADAVQTHMTNSRLTDPEVLEKNFPVVLKSFSIRKGSGGEGRWRGGNGAIRELLFTEAVHASILSNHRRIAPFGVRGGGDGKVGRNSLRRADGSTEILPGNAGLSMGPGDTMIIETPGGGAFGRIDT